MIRDLEHRYEGTLTLRFTQTADRKLPDAEILEHLKVAFAGTSVTRDGCHLVVGPVDDNSWTIEKRPEGEPAPEERPPIRTRNVEQWLKR